jgi:predicted nucleotidyltransferase
VPSVNPSIRALLASYRRLLEQHLGNRLVQLTLFGSYARGEARAESDVDVAVIIDQITKPADRMLPAELAADVMLQWDICISPLVLSVSELEFLRQREDLLAENLEREGISV